MCVCVQCTTMKANHALVDRIRSCEISNCIIVWMKWNFRIWHCVAGALDLESAIRAIKCAHFGGTLQNCDVFFFLSDLFDNDNIALIWVFNLQCRLSDDTINVWPLSIPHAVVCSCISAKAKNYGDGEFLKKSQDYGENPVILPKQEKLHQLFIANCLA